MGAGGGGWLTAIIRRKTGVVDTAVRLNLAEDPWRPRAGVGWALIHRCDKCKVLFGGGKPHAEKWPAFDGVAQNTPAKRERTSRPQYTAAHADLARRFLVLCFLLAFACFTISKPPAR